MKKIITFLSLIFIQTLIGQETDSLATTPIPADSVTENIQPSADSTAQTSIEQPTVTPKYEPLKILDPKELRLEKI
ncbi:MAG: hypothetical protein Q8K92_26385, partial [Leadbetterella sp.]|nr:hypothetical protein [Leadbetterella sp.]